MRVEMNARSLALLALLVAGCSDKSPPPANTAPLRVLASAAAATPTVPSTWAYPMQGQGAPSPHGAVTSDCELATKVGLDVLRQGGNAVDAAVATAFAMAVAYPTAGNLGGGGFAVVRFGADERALDFRETAPAAASRDMFVEAPDAGAPLAASAAPAADEARVLKKSPHGPRMPRPGRGGDAGRPPPVIPNAVPEVRDAGAPAPAAFVPSASQMGWRSSGTPGSVAGLWALHAAKGSVPWKKLLAPAIAMARDGIVVSAAFADEIDSSKKRLAADPASAALFLPDGAAPKVGSTWKNPDLAKVLDRVAELGPKGFYEGETAGAIVSEMKSHGGLITADDLHGYEAKWRAPLVFNYRGSRVVSMPPPSSGGVTLAMIGHILEGFDLPREAWHSPAEVHDLLEAMRRAFAARNARLGDPDFVTNPLDELLSKEWADAQRATIKVDKATPSSEIASIQTPHDGPHTTNFCVVDAEGNAVALTTTINWFFGNGITVAGTGMVLNNEMDDFAVKPGNANGFGLVQGEPNAIAPKKRMLSSMSPIVVTGADGKVQLVTGAAGGPRIITATLQVMLNSLDHGLDPVAALDAPRFHMQHLPDVVLFEKDGLDATLRSPLEAMGYTFKEAGHLADANVIGRVNGGWVAAADPRRMGSFAAGW